MAFTERKSTAFFLGAKRQRDREPTAPQDEKQKKVKFPIGTSDLKSHFLFQKKSDKKLRSFLQSFLETKNYLLQNYH